MNSIKFISYDILYDDNVKRRTRLREYSRLQFDNANVQTFLVDKDDIPLDNFQKASGISDVLVVRPNTVQKLTRIELSTPLYSPLETNEWLILELGNVNYTFNQTDEDTTKITWPDSSTTDITAGETVSRNNYLFSGGSIMVEAGDDCQEVINSGRNCTTILNSYNSNGCCGAAHGQCSIDVLEYNCGNCCSS